MSWISRSAALYRQLFQRRQAQRELDAEVGSYFEELVDRYIEQGMSREAAQRTARVKFEGPEQVKQKVSETQTGAVIEPRSETYVMRGECCEKIRASRRSRFARLRSD